MPLFIEHLQFRELEFERCFQAECWTQLMPLAAVIVGSPTAGMNGVGHAAVMLS